MCTEVVRIVQEGLSSVRKHSGARHVSVRITEANARWRLTIEDDGRGLDAAATKLSPMVIKECVRSLGGELKLQSAPGSGLRLEIVFTGRVDPEEGRPVPPTLAAATAPAMLLPDSARHLPIARARGLAKPPEGGRPGDGGARDVERQR